MWSGRASWLVTVPFLLALIWVEGFDGTGLEGGTVTGPALKAYVAGTLTIAGATILGVRLTLAARPMLRILRLLLTLVGAFLCAPILTYFLSPWLFRTVFPGPYLGHDMRPFALDWPPLIAAVSLLATVIVVAMASRPVSIEPTVQEFD